MNIYFIQTSHREGYTYEKLTKEWCIENNELFKWNSEILRDAPHSDMLYKVFYMRDVRGDLEHAGIKYFFDKDLAESYLSSVNNITINDSKKCKGYGLQAHPLYNRLTDIPIKAQIDPVTEGQLSWQKREHNETSLTFDEKVARLIAERSLPNRSSTSQTVHLGADHISRDGGVITHC